MPGRVTLIEIVLRHTAGGIEWGAALVASSIWAAAVPATLQGQAEHSFDERLADWLASLVFGRASE